MKKFKCRILPILFALYRVIWNIPAYVSSVKEVFVELAQSLVGKEGVQELMAEVAKSAIYLALDNIGNYKEEDFIRIQQMETEVDKYEDEADKYVKLLLEKIKMVKTC